MLWAGGASYYSQFTSVSTSNEAVGEWVAIPKRAPATAFQPFIYLQDLRIAGRYQLQRRIGGGAFGSVYIGNATLRYWKRALVYRANLSVATNIETGEEVALKLEHIDTYPSFLELEVEYLQLLAGGVGIPRVREYLTECDYNVMVLDLLGPSLEDLFNFCRRHFSLKTVLMLADQLLRRLEYIHSKDLIHRDVKPENFLMGTGRCGNLVYATDMGLATERRDFESQAKPAGGSRRRLIGTARFASVRGHLGVGQCPSPSPSPPNTEEPHRSAASPRRHGISWIHVRLLPPRLPSLAGSESSGPAGEG